VEVIGRDAELRHIVEFIDSGRSGLVLIVGEHRVGKRYVLIALRERLQHRHTVLPARADDEIESNYLTITGSTSVAELKHVLAESMDDHHGDEVEGSRVLLVSGYQANAAAARWLRTGKPFETPDARSRSAAPGSDAPTPARPSSSTVIVIAALPDDVGKLLSVADHIEELAPLPADVVADELRRATDGLSEPLSDAELERYVAGVVADASVLPSLKLVLALDSSREAS
jgi:hypothetical protein